MTNRPAEDAPEAEVNTRYYLCMTCGSLKSERLIEEGDCTCQDCYREGRSQPLWAKAEDGDGFVTRQDSEKAPSCHEENGGDGE